MTIQCRYCRGERPHNGKVCLGCGAPIANATVRAKPVKAPRYTCPRCGSGKYVHADGRLSCKECWTVYEPPDFGYVDTRPVENAIKQEERHGRARR